MPFFGIIGKSHSKTEIKSEFEQIEKKLQEGDQSVSNEARNVITEALQALALEKEFFLQNKKVKISDTEDIDALCKLTKTFIKTHENLAFIGVAFFSAVGILISGTYAIVRRELDEKKENALKAEIQLLENKKTPS